ncbi:MAG TPA: EamA family transporter [Polyangiaceae bacterium]|nr:EamA family transporter [Polyangiaceae bacterium]
MSLGQRKNPLLRSVLTAALAAVLFGATIPLLQRASNGLGAFVTAALLYAGAALGTTLSPGDSHSRALQRQHWPRIVGVAILGATLAPVCLAWGLQRSSAFTASLLLNFEAVFTIAFAAIAYREYVGKRVGVAAAAMLVGGVLLARSEATGSLEGVWGALAVLLAVACWALDNTLMRPLAELRPSSVVRAKALVGAALSAAAAVALEQKLPSLRASVTIALCGALGYGVSLRLYLRAQRHMGAVRTGSVFALAPFLGAALSWIALPQRLGWMELLATALFALGLYLHLSERHEHAHIHELTEHEHAHRHDDGHHNHSHDVMPDGEHSHRHRHEPIEHVHTHGEDIHHRHHG